MEDVNRNEYEKSPSWGGSGGNEAKTMRAFYPTGTEYPTRRVKIANLVYAPTLRLFEPSHCFYAHGKLCRQRLNAKFGLPANGTVELNARLLWGKSLSHMDHWSLLICYMNMARRSIRLRKRSIDLHNRWLAAAFAAITGQDDLSTPMKGAPTQRR